MAYAGQKRDEPNETSPLRTRTSGRTSFEIGDGIHQEEHEAMSYATWSAKTWTTWNKATRGLILVLGVTLIIVVIVLIASVSTGSGSGSDGGGGVLKASGDENSADNTTQQDLGVVLEIPQGRLKWNILQSRQGRDYYAFYKVPYAKPPIGELRFESPQPPEKWEGVRHETEVAPQCLQKAKYSPIIEAVGEEDCLYANIYTPKLPEIDMPSDAALMPTLFYIHGGGYTDGNGSRYGGKYFMDEDAVLVTFQYRLGIFGFLSSEDGTIRGNMGMRDHVQALKWVKENIKYFGGDPDRVMIYGNSAGAMSVNQLMVSPLAAGLFHRAITQSGPAFGAIVKPKEAQKRSFELLAEEIGCSARVGSEQRKNRRILKCLRDQNASDIAVIRGEEIIFNPTVEDYEAEAEQESDKFLPDTTYNLYKTGNVNKVPWIVGVNSAEWIHIAASTLTDLELVDNLNSNWTGYAPTLFSSEYDTSPIKDTISTKSKEFYFGEKQVSNDTLSNLEHLLSDRDIIYGSKMQGFLMSDLGVDVFFYYMSKRPAKSYSDKALADFPPMDYGASHADELQYLFDYYGYPEYLEGSKYYEFSKELVRIWVQFAATAKPGWESIKTSEKPIYWYELNDNHMGPTTVLQERMEFWDQFSHEDLCYV